MEVLYLLNESARYQDNLSRPQGQPSDIHMNMSNYLKNQSDKDSEICPRVTDEQLEFLNLSSLILEGIIQMIICMFGIMGNTASIYLLSRPELKSSFNQLLAVLASFDLLYLITMFLESMRILGCETDFHIFMFPYFLYPINFIAMTGSIFMTVGAAPERYIAVYYPLYYNKILTDTSS